MANTFLYGRSEPVYSLCSWALKYVGHPFYPLLICCAALLVASISFCRLSPAPRITIVSNGPSYCTKHPDFLVDMPPYFSNERNILEAQAIIQHRYSSFLPCVMDMANASFLQCSHDLT